MNDRMPSGPTHLESIDEPVRELVDEWILRREDGKDAGTIECAESFRRKLLLKGSFLTISFVLLLAIMGFSFTIGDYKIGFWETYSCIINSLLGNEVDPVVHHIIFNLRFPRIFAGVLAGAGLAIAGAVMQTLLLNPMAETYTTGVSAGAGLGATLAVCLGISVFGLNGELMVVTNAFVFSLIPMIAIMILSYRKGLSPTSVIMFGIAVMFIFNALTTLICLRADPNDLEYVYRWMVGSLSFVNNGSIPFMLAAVLIGSFVLFVHSSKMNKMALGEDYAISMGVNPKKTMYVCLMVCSLIAACIVSFTGTISFVGLVAPHICRMILGSDNRFVLPASVLVGSLLLLTADIIGRTIISPAILETGVVMAFLGCPVLIYLVIRTHKRGVI